MHLGDPDLLGDLGLALLTEEPQHHDGPLALRQGVHLVIVDLFPPTRRDPQGIHGALAAEFHDDYTAPPDKPLTLASYSAGPPAVAYVEPTAVGTLLAEMPLFLEPDEYVNVPLEATYQEAWRGVPQRWRAVLEGPAGA